MKRLLLTISCVALAGSVAIAQKGAEKANGDQKFVEFAAQTDMVEANLGQLAASNGESQEVKDYGQMLTTDHTKDFGLVSDAAKQSNLNVPTAIDAEHNKAMIDPFQKLSGAAFDHKYIQEMIAGHTKAIAMYKKEATQAQDQAIKSYAENALPTLQKHLDEAKKLTTIKPAAK